jgi:hypothetical protein
MHHHSKADRAHDILVDRVVKNNYGCVGRGSKPNMSPSKIYTQIQNRFQFLQKLGIKPCLQLKIVIIKCQSIAEIEI